MHPEARLAAFVGVLLGSACGGDASPATLLPDGSVVQDSSILPDAATDAPFDVSADHVVPDASTVQHPADTSFSIAHGIRGCLTAPFLMLETDAPTTVGATPIPKGVTTVDGSYKVVKSYNNGDRLGDCGLGESANGFDEFSPPHSFGGPGVAPRARYSGGAFAYDSVVSTWSGCPSMTANCNSYPVVYGSIGILSGLNSYSENVIRAVPQNMGRAAADSVFGTAGQFAVSGRIEQGTFDFDITKVGTFVATGPAVFVVDYTNINSVVSVKWLMSFPTTTIPKISPGNQNDEPFYGSRLGGYSSTPTSYMLTIPYLNTLDLGSAGKFTAPNASYATAVLVLDKATGQVAWAQSFAKGPKSLGKVTRARLVDMQDGTFVYYDTVWDTIDLGGGNVATAGQGADVLIAALNSKGVLIKYWLWGGAGDDEFFDAGGGKGAAAVVGHSTSTIDLGNGPLTAGIWAATVTL